jgi:PTS system nitrogen regulatory IIA component
MAGLFSWISDMFGSTPPREAKPGIRMSDFLTEKTIVFFPSAPSKRQVLGHLIGLLELPDPNAALDSMLVREETGSTVIAPGLAVPHARVSGLARLQAAIGICPEGVMDRKSDSGPVRIYVMFLGNSENMTQHLAFLARVSALFETEAFRESLILAGSPARVLEILRKAE